MTQYLIWIDKHWDDLKVRLPKMVRQWTEQAVGGDSDQHPRLPGAVAGLYAGLDTVLSFLVEEGVIEKARARNSARVAGISS